MPMRVIDLRSDTVTHPCPEMRAAMAAAEVGDDVYGEDPTVNRLEAFVADLLGTEAALFASSGTQANLLALLVHCRRGDEYIAGQTAHCYRFEGGGAAALGGIQPQPLDVEADGTLDLATVRRAIKPDDPHFARTRLLCLENTTAGRVLPLEYLKRSAALAREHGLVLHLDGARLFNAAVALGVPARAIVRHFDTVAVCLAKGLGAPVGSLLCGRREQVGEARRWRKMLGGGMRQVGVLAAAGLFALERNVERLAEDHANARRLAAGLAAIEGVTIGPIPVQTNMVFLCLPPEQVDALARFLRPRGILVAGRENLRLVTHRDVTAADVATVIAAFREFFTNSAN